MLFDPVRAQHRSHATSSICLSLESISPDWLWTLYRSLLFSLLFRHCLILDSVWCYGKLSNVPYILSARWTLAYLFRLSRQWQNIGVLTTRKLCCRKETAQYRELFFRYLKYQSYHRMHSTSSTAFWFLFAKIFFADLMTHISPFVNQFRRLRSSFKECCCARF